MIAIWEWIKSIFKKRPLVKITILSFLLLGNLNAQRTDLQYLFAYFTQPSIENSDLWSIVWYGEDEDSVYVYKNDTLRCKVFQDSSWVAFSLYEKDTVEVRLLLDRSFQYDSELHFFAFSRRDTLGLVSDPDSVTVHFMGSDINMIIDNTVEGYTLGDHRVDGLDLIELARNFGKTGLGYRDFYDITGDGKVDGLDLIQLSKDFGRTYTF